MKFPIQLWQIMSLFFGVEAFGYSSETLNVTSPFTHEVYKVSLLTTEESKELFNLFANKSLISFDLIHDGCYERAYLMITHAKLKKVEFGKTVVEVTNPHVAKIEVISPDVPWILRWNYHVAPYAFVKTPDGGIQKLIFDPSLFDSPVTQDVFVKRMNQDPKLEIDVFDLPSYVIEKNQLNSEVNIERLDRAMMKNLSAARDMANLHGRYLEKTPLLDKDQNLCYKGGLLVERTLCGN